MARIVKEEAYAVKRNEILDATQRLVYTKGYEQMTIQDILDDLKISKGAFYHYFDSKPALLEALIERIQEEAEQLINPIVHDPHLPALEKFQRFIDTLARWKTAQKTFLLALWHVLYMDDNAIFRQKVRDSGLKRFAPVISVIIRQGVQEGVLTTSYPDTVGEVALSLVLDLADTLASLLLSYEPGRDELGRVEGTVAAYSDALERVLGAPTGSLILVDSEILREWFLTPGDNV
jgi:AcrR family transcriptional regulator